MSEQVEFLTRIIPDVHMKAAVYNATHNEFEKGYNSAACKTAKQKASVFHIDIYNVNQKKGQTSRKQHGPVCVSSCNDLDQSVNYSAEAKNCQVFSDFTFNHIITNNIITQKERNLQKKLVPFSVIYLLVQCSKCLTQAQRIP